MYMLDMKTDKAVQHKFFIHSVLALTFLLICRIVSMCYVPLNDYSEARYAEIARKMLETGNWVTPLHTYQMPFWAKPPLSTWLSALSMKCFGVNEFAVRLPGLLLSIGVLWLVWDLAKKHSGSVTAWASTLVLAGTLYFFLDAGTVMTDPSLIFCTALCTVAFWHAFVERNKIWSYVFFAGLGLGMLAKGPIAVVLTGLPVFFWVLIRNEWLNLWRRLPWVVGTLLATVLALPWYVLAELRTPGFINYFIVGEHFNRFVHPGWEGDKYGHAHKQPWGMIWLFALAGIFPWSIPASVWGVRYFKQISALFKDADGWMSYLLLSTLIPLVFFTFSSNIIYTYTFPVMAPFALLFAEFWRRTSSSPKSMDMIVRFSVVVGYCFLGATLVFILKPEMVAKTQKPIVQAWLQQEPDNHSKLIYWDYSADYSAEFYAAGRVVATKDMPILCPELANNSVNYLVIDPANKGELPAELMAQFKPIFTQVYKDKTKVLLRGPRITCNNQGKPN